MTSVEAPRTELLTPAVCNRISHPCAPPAHPTTCQPQSWEVTCGSGWCCDAWKHVCQRCPGVRCPGGGQRWAALSSLGSRGARAAPAPPLLPPSHGITRFLGADSESGKAGTPSRQGRDKKLLLKVCFLNVFKCHICFV